MKHRAKGIAGFTLIEILVALAILAGALVVLTEGYVNALNALAPPPDRPDEQRELAFVRERVLKLPARELLEQGGEFETLTAGRVRWEAQLIETTILDLHQVVLSCEFAESGERYRMEFTALRPHWSDPVERGRLREEKVRALESRRMDQRWNF